MYETKDRETLVAGVEICGARSREEETGKSVVVFGLQGRAVVTDNTNGGKLDS